MSGAQCETITSLPFGDGMSTAGSCADVTPLHFTGKQRDSESGLDYFGARYFSSNVARFMSPDWAAKPTTVPYANFGDPQSLDLYGYVRDNPLSDADADGHDYICWVFVYQSAKKFFTSPGVKKMASSLGVKLTGGVGAEYGVRSPWGNFKAGAAVTGQVSVSSRGVSVSAVAEAKVKASAGPIQGEVKAFSVKDQTLQNGRSAGNKITAMGPNGEFGTKHTEVTGEKGEVDLGVTASADGGVAGSDVTIKPKQFEAGFEQLLQSQGAGPQNLPRPQ